MVGIGTEGKHPIALGVYHQIRFGKSVLADAF
jgi:hypothetical protein